MTNRITLKAKLGKNGRIRSSKSLTCARITDLRRSYIQYVGCVIGIRMQLSPPLSATYSPNACTQSISQALIRRGLYGRAVQYSVMARDGRGVGQIADLLLQVYIAKGVGRVLVFCLRILISITNLQERMNSAVKLLPYLVFFSPSQADHVMRTIATWFGTCLLHVSNSSFGMPSFMTCSPGANGKMPRDC
jgi:hypothetical protein